MENVKTGSVDSVRSQSSSRSVRMDLRHLSFLRTLFVCQSCC